MKKVTPVPSTPPTDSASDVLMNARSYLNHLNSFSDTSAGISARSIAKLVYKSNSLPDTLDGLVTRIARVLVLQGSDIAKAGLTDKRIYLDRLLWLRSYTTSVDEVFLRLKSSALEPSLATEWQTDLLNILDAAHIAGVAAEKPPETYPRFYLSLIFLPFMSLNNLKRIARKKVNPTLPEEMAIVIPGPLIKVQKMLAACLTFLLCLLLSALGLGSDSTVTLINNLLHGGLSYIVLCFLLTKLTLARWSTSGQIHFSEVKREAFDLWLTSHDKEDPNVSTYEVLSFLCSPEFAGIEDTSLKRFLLAPDPQNPKSEESFHNILASNPNNARQLSGQKRFSLEYSNVTKKVFSVSTMTGTPLFIAQVFLSALFGFSDILLGDGELDAQLVFVSLCAFLSAVGLSLVTTGRIEKYSKDHINRLESQNRLVHAENINTREQIHFKNRTNINSWWKLRNFINSFFSGHLLNFGAVSVCIVVSFFLSVSLFLYASLTDILDPVKTCQGVSFSVLCFSITAVPLFQVARINEQNNRDQVLMLQYTRYRLTDQLDCDDERKDCASRLGILIDIIEASNHLKHKLLGITVSFVLLRTLATAVISSFASVVFKMLINR
jgi:hypothetical protein